MTKLMKAMIVLAGGVLFTSPAWADTAAQKKAEQEVNRLVHEIVAAYATPDVDKYFSYYADDMDFCCGAGGWSTKQDYYKGWKQGVVNGGGVSKAEPVDLRIQASTTGDSAISTYQMRCTRRKPNEGQNPEVTYNMTEVWMHRNGKWQIANVTFSVAGPGTPGPATEAAKK